MEEIGVEAVVKGLSAFLSDTKKLNNAIDGLRPSGTLLQRVFSGLTDTLGSFGREILNVAEYALGHLLADAVQFVISQLGDLARATLDAGAEFQTLSLRLTRLNFNSLINSGEDFNKAQRDAIALTKEQLSWITRLANTTPYDAQDIANVFTLARSYGFAADAAKGLTEDITNFAAGMGLGNTEIERIIVNFGQMVQQGKVSQREMNDLARGAFVPVNDVITQMRKNVAGLSDTDLKALSTATGISEYNLRHIADTTKSADSSFTELKKTGEGVNLWMQAFSDLVQGRFGGAAEDMARTFQGATDNAKDFIKSVFGLGVVKPVLDVVGGKIADMISSMSSDPKVFDSIVKAAAHLGDIVSGVVDSLLTMIGLTSGAPAAKPIDTEGLTRFEKSLMEGPSTKGFGENITTKLYEISAWVADHKDDILKFFTNIGTIIETKVVPFITSLVDNFKTIRSWVDENKPTIDKFFSTLGQIVGDVLGVNIKKGAGLEGFLQGLTTFMQFVIDNKDQITKLADALLRLFITWQIFTIMIGFVIGLFVGIGSAILSVVATIAGFLGVLSFLDGLLGLVGASLFGVIAAFAAIIGIVIAVIAEISILVAVFQAAPAIFSSTIENIKTMFTDLWTNAVTAVDNVISAFQNHDWAGVGSAIVDGIKGGWEILWNTFKSIIGDDIQAIADVFKNWPWIQVGIDLIQGIINGILGMAGALVAAVQSVLGMADAGAREVLHAHSPSETGASLGADWIAGIVLGIQSATDSVTQAVLGQIALLVGYFQTLPVMISAALLNHDWTGVGTAIVDAIKNGWSIEFGALADVFINNMLSLQKKFRENTQWKLIGQLIIHGIAAGVLAAAQELATAAANVVSAAIAAARKAAGIHSPSTEGIDLGANFVSGVVIGIQQSTAGAVKVMSNAMSAIMAPALAMPAITQQYAVSAPASVNNTNSYTNNWNLNIHSQARTEQVIQDYNMMRALAGA